MTKTPEKKIKDAMIAHAKSRGACVIPVPGGVYGLPGSPDHILCYKGKSIALEGKTYRGQQSEDQKTIQEEFERAGGIYILGKHITHLEKVLDKIDEETQEI